MFEFPLYTTAEIAADPRLAALLEDKRLLLDGLCQIAGLGDATRGSDLAIAFVAAQASIERQREAAHYAAVQAENVRQGWRPATFREILGEPLYDDTARDED